MTEPWERLAALFAACWRDLVCVLLFLLACGVMGWMGWM